MKEQEFAHKMGIKPNFIRFFCEGNFVKFQTMAKELGFDIFEDFVCTKGKSHGKWYGYNELISYNRNGENICKFSRWNVHGWVKAENYDKVEKIFGKSQSNEAIYAITDDQVIGICRKFKYEIKYKIAKVLTQFLIDSGRYSKGATKYDIEVGVAQTVWNEIKFWRTTDCKTEMQPEFMVIDECVEEMLEKKLIVTNKEGRYLLPNWFYRKIVDEIYKGE